MVRERPRHAGCSMEVRPRVGAAGQGIGGEGFTKAGGRAWTVTSAARIARWGGGFAKKEGGQARSGEEGPINGEVISSKKREAKHAVGRRGRSMGRWFHQRRGRPSTLVGGFPLEWRESEHARGGSHDGEVVWPEKREAEHTSGGVSIGVEGGRAHDREDCAVGRWFHWRRRRSRTSMGEFLSEWREAEHARGGSHGGEVVSLTKREAEHVDGHGFC